MKFSKALAIILTVIMTMALAACSDGNDAPSVSIAAPSSSEAEQPPQEESSAPDNLADETVQVAFNVPIIGDMGIDYGKMDFTIRIPKIWTVASMELLEGETKVAEVLTAQPISQYVGENGQEQNVFEAETDFRFGGEDCVSSGDFAAGGYAGKYYQRQYEYDGPHTDVIYCLDTGDCLILILFNLIEGTDVETQIEQFTALATTIEVSKA